MVGGTAYAAGRHAANTQQREEDQQARIDALEQQQAMASAPPPPAPAAAQEPDLASKLTELKGLLDQGVLTQEEFTAAKQKLLAG
jgi:hypothetical protein